MAASDHISPKLFHGSVDWLRPGDVLRPGEDIFYEEPAGSYATTSLPTARTYARDKLQAKNSHIQGGQKALFAPIYEVSHVSQHSDPDGAIRKEYPEGHVRRDTEGFRVNKIAGYAHWNGT